MAENDLKWPKSPWPNVPPAKNLADLGVEMLIYIYTYVNTSPQIQKVNFAYPSPIEIVDLGSDGHITLFD